MKRAAFFAAAAILSASSAASAAGDGVLDAPAPPTLPALAHPSLTYTLELTAAGIAPKQPDASGERAFAWFAHNELELPLESRKWYVGAAHDIAAGAVPGVGHDFLFGNPELWVRGLWSSAVGLSSGGGFGVVLPFPRDLGGQAGEILETVRVVRPWDAAYFTDRVLTFRPWFDIRHVVGRFIVQLRQGLDIALALRTLHTKEHAIELPSRSLVVFEPYEHRAELVARATLYLGLRVTQEIGVGVEAWEVYQVSADLPDDKRSAVAISPSIRFMLGRVAPALSVLLPITTPLRGEAASYYAARLNVGFDFDAGLPKRSSRR